MTSESRYISDIDFIKIGDAFDPTNSFFIFSSTDQRNSAREAAKSLTAYKFRYSHRALSIKSLLSLLLLHSTTTTTKMATRAIGSINARQLPQLPRQMRRGPAELANIAALDKDTGLASDAFLAAAWDPTQRHVILNLPVFIKQIETKLIHLQGGGEKLVTNVLVSNGSLMECQLTGWGRHAEQIAGLKPGDVLKCI